MDQAHAYTDEKLDEIEKRVAREYSAALSQLREKMAGFEQWYEKENAKWLKLVDNGERTQEQYQSWLKGKALTSKLWRERVDAMASDLTNSAQISMAIVNGELPDVYAENHNWGTYEIEHGTTVNTMYTLYDRDTVSKIIRDGDFLYPQAAVDVAKDKLWNRQHITSAITQGILQGESITDIAKRLRNVAAMSSATAMRAARTCTTAAENAGRVDSYKRAKDMGIEVKKQWLATLDTRTRSSHRRLDGESVEIDGEFSNGLKFPGDPDGPGSEVYNCFLGDVNVDCDSDVLRSYRSLYVGKTITVDTAMGVHFTCTPNHPILTDRGWVAADGLHDGDNLFVTARARSTRCWEPDVEHGFTSFKAVHKLLAEFGSKWVSGLSVDFHGDRPATNVQIVSKERFLRECVNFCGFNSVDELILELSNSSGHCEGLISALFERAALFTPSDMRSFREALSFVLGGISHPDIHGFGTVSRLDPGIAQNAIDNLPAETMVRSELLNGLSGKVLLDKIVNVEVGSTRGSHVYNLQTDDGYYFVNTIVSGKCNGIFAIAKNCRCTLVADLAEFPAEDVDRASKLSGMSYDEWRESKETKKEKPKKVKASKVETTKSGKTKVASTDQEVKQPGTTSMRTSYTQRELRDMDRSQLEAIAREVARKMASDQGISEEEALRRFNLLIDAQTDAQLRQYINRNGK